MKNQNDNSKSKVNSRKPNHGGNRKGNRNRTYKENYPKNNKEELVKEGKGDDINDSSFYYTEETLKKQLTDYTLTGFLGMPIRVGQYRSDASASASTHELNYGTPSIMRIAINPSLETVQLIRNLYGSNASNNAGIAKVAQKNFYLLSANNAKTTNYQQNDVTLLLVSIGQIASYVGFIKRAFGSMFKYNIRNRDLPKELIGAMNINYDDFSKNFANYRIRFNVILNTLNRLPLPGNVAYIAKWGSMYSNFYLDEYNNDLAQWYLLTPYSFWKFNELKSDTGSGFDTVVINSANTTTPLTMQQHLNNLEDMIQAVCNSSTFNYIFSDILKLSSNSGLPLLKFEMLLEGYDAPTLFSEEFNLWVENADIVGVPLDEPRTSIATAGNDVYSDVTTGTITYNPYFPMRKWDMNSIVNFKNGEPNVEQKIAAMRLKHGRSWVYNENNEQGIWAPDAYVCFVETLVTNPDNNKRQWGASAIGANGYDATLTIGQLALFSSLTQFNYAPKIVFHDPSDTDSKNAVILGALDFYTEVPVKVLTEMYDAEWLGLLEMR